jgi:hypothetical protein
LTQVKQEKISTSQKQVYNNKNVNLADMKQQKKDIWGNKLTDSTGVNIARLCNDRLHDSTNPSIVLHQSNINTGLSAE